MQNKPTSKVIQILTNITEEIATVRPSCFAITALCEDGSIWQKNNVDSWTCILEAPIQPKNDLPSVGSKWKRKFNNNSTITSFVITHGESVTFMDEDSGCSQNYDLEDFLKYYEPIPTKKESDAK